MRKFPSLINIYIIGRNEDFMNTKYYKVSVIVPIYNVEEYIDRCVESIVSQSYDYLEIILIDDGSKDTSSRIADNWAKRDSRIRVIHQNNGGLSVARNNGIEAATGSHIIFVDSDDWIQKDMVAGLVAGLEDAEIVCCGMIRATDTQATDIPWYSEKKVLSSSEVIKMLIENKTFTAHAQKNIYPKYLFDNIKFPAGKLFEDIRTTHKLFSNVERICILPEHYYYYYVRDDSITNVVKLRNQIEWYEALEERAKDLAHILSEEEVEMVQSQKAVVMSLAMVQYDFSNEEKSYYKSEIEQIKRFLQQRNTRNAVRKYGTKTQYIYYLLARTFFFSANKIYKVFGVNR